MSGCQNDSDFVVGRYEVVTTVRESNCPESLSPSLEAAILPTGLLAGETHTLFWTIRRVGITGNGDNQVSLELHAAGVPERVLLLSGEMSDDIMRVEQQQELSPEIYRFILLHASFDGEQIRGDIRTLLSQSGDSSDIPVHAPCETHEQFIGVMEEWRSGVLEYHHSITPSRHLNVTYLVVAVFSVRGHNQ